MKPEVFGLTGEGTLRYPDGRLEAIDRLPNAADVPGGSQAIVTEYNAARGKLLAYEVTYLRPMDATTWREQARRRRAR